MVELLALMLVAWQPTGTIENALTQGTARDSSPDKIVCVRQTRIGSRLDNRRVCRTRAEWDQLEAEERNVVDRVQRFQGCVDPSICPRGGVSDRPGGR
jgi:hypothetical protein